MLLLSGLVGIELSQTLPVAKIVATLESFALMTSAMFVAIVACELVNGASLERYLTRNFATDLLYRCFYSGGVYPLLFYSPIADLAQTHLAFLDLQVLLRMPLAASLAVYWLSLDFMNYWLHRLQHTRFWWRFHSIHHSQEVLTFATGQRFHVLDQLVPHIIITIPALILGVPVVVWLPYTLTLTFINAIQHSGLTWTLGPLRYVLVSPLFHGVHHSTEASHCHRNYGTMFVFWDYLFGTALDVKERPAHVGLDGWKVPESVIDHFFAPFRRRTYPGATPPRPEPGPPEPLGSGRGQVTGW